MKKPNKRADLLTLKKASLVFSFKKVIEEIALESYAYGPNANEGSRATTAGRLPSVLVPESGGSG